MVTKNLETPKESELNDFMNEEATLKAEISKNADPSIDEIEGIKKPEINAKELAIDEIETMEKYEIAKEWVCNLAKLVKKHYELINSAWTLEAREKMQSQPDYIATMQATLNIMNQSCKITWTYDEKTKESLAEFVKERWGNEPILDAHWHLSRSNRLVLVNALLHPNDITKANRRDTRNFSSLEPDLQTWLKNTNWQLEKWKIEIWIIAYNNPGRKKNYPYRYPTWTHRELRNKLPEDMDK